jgi:predicted PurR-regulated permease PerM
MQNKFNIKTIISILLIVILGFTIIGIIGKVLIPFLIALILAYILNPLVENLNNRLKISRDFISLITSFLVFIFFISVPLFVLPTLINQVKTVITKAPELITAINSHILTNINSKYGTHFNIDINVVKQTFLDHITQIYNHVDLFSPIAKNSFILVEIILYIVLIPFILFYAIKNWHSILQFFDSLIPRSYVNTTHAIIKDIDTMMSAYLRGQLSVMLIMAIYYGIALHFVSITSGLIVGIMTGLMVFVPYLGILTGLIVSLCISITDFTSMNQIIAILIIFAVGHVLEGGLVTPFLVGGKIGLNPIMIILALMIFGKAFGIVGVLLALPLATIAVVILKYARLYYINSQYYREN